MSNGDTSCAGAALTPCGNCRRRHFENAGVPSKCGVVPKIVIFWSVRPAAAAIRFRPGSRRPQSCPAAPSGCGVAATCRLAFVRFLNLATFGICCVPAGIDFFVAKCVLWRGRTGVKAMGVEGVAWVIIALVFLSIWRTGAVLEAGTALVAGDVPRRCKRARLMGAASVPVPCHEWNRNLDGLPGHSRHYCPTFSWMNYGFVYFLRRRKRKTTSIPARRSRDRAAPGPNATCPHETARRRIRHIWVFSEDPSASWEGEILVWIYEGIDDVCSIDFNRRRKMQSLSGH